MSQLKVRRIPFEFAGVEFLWNPHEPAFSVFINAISFWVIGLERYFVKAFRDAIPRINDPGVRDEARLFQQQEAQHSLCHKRHVAALIDRYPGLQDAYDGMIAAYDALYEQHDLDYHLAYAAALEGTFSPFFNMIIDNRGTLFRGGDSRVASLNLWHFCEEIEHRSSAVIVYDHVVGSALLKMRTFRPMQRHVRACQESLRAEFQKHVPGEAGAAHYDADPFATVPRLQRLRMNWGVLQSQMPWHDPEHQPLPPWADKWFAHYERGDDMTHFYGVRSGGSLA